MSKVPRLAVISAVLSGLAGAALLLRPRRTVAPMAVGLPPRHPAPPARATPEFTEVARGEPGSGGYYGTWRKNTDDAAVAPHLEFQYAGIEHQTETAMAGMWLFLATELLFFGGLFLLYMIYRSLNAHAFAVASHETEVVFGTINVFLLVTSSAVYAWGLGQVREGRALRMTWACAAVALLGTLFLVLKLWEWSDDLAKNLFPGHDFKIGGIDGHGAQLFWCFYWVGTVLHGVHMVIGVGLVSWIGWASFKGHYSPRYHTPVEGVGLYWSFVDMVWLCLYPMIYLVDGFAR